jgi:hypothetical protein
MEAKLTNDPDELVEVRVLMPAKLRDRLFSICAQFDLKFDEIVCHQLEKLLLRHAITILEAEDTGGRPFDPRR